MLLVKGLSDSLSLVQNNFVECVACLSVTVKPRYGGGLGLLGAVVQCDISVILTGAEFLKCLND